MAAAAAKKMKTKSNRLTSIFLKTLTVAAVRQLVLDYFYYYYFGLCYLRPFRFNSISIKMVNVIETI